jgi:hypothetical protein
MEKFVGLGQETLSSLAAFAALEARVNLIVLGRRGPTQKHTVEEVYLGSVGESSGQRGDGEDEEEGVRVRDEIAAFYPQKKGGSVEDSHLGVHEIEEYFHQMRQ